MLGLTYSAQGSLELQRHDIPHIIASDDAIIRVTYASICTSDFHIRDGFVPKAKPGTILGHEYVGVVEQIGEHVKALHPGDHVSASCLTMCGSCWFCEHKYFNNCQRGGWRIGCTENGGLASHVRVPFADHSLTLIPHGLADLDCLFVGDILATGYFGAQMCDARQDDNICVLGAGPCGLCTAMCLTRVFGAKCYIVDILEERRQFAQRLGFGTLLTVDQAEVKAVEFGINGGFDAVVDCAGSESSFGLAVNLCRCHGTVGVVAMYDRAQKLDLVNYYGKNLVFKTGGVDAGYGAELIEMLRNGVLDCKWMVGKIYGFSQIAEALRAFEAHEHIKVAIDMSK